MEGVRIATYDLLPRDALFVGSVDDLVVDVRDVLDEGDLVTSAPQISRDHIPEKGRPSVADVYVIVDRRTADIDTDLPILSDLYQATA
jgi:hypothetical protein